MFDRLSHLMKCMTNTSWTKMFDRLAGPNKDHFPDQISNLATTMFSNQVEKSPLDLVSPEPNIELMTHLTSFHLCHTPIAEPLLEKRLGRSVSLNNY